MNNVREPIDKQLIIVDELDKDLLDDFDWYDYHGYATNQSGWLREYRTLHRIIAARMGLDIAQSVDHIDRNTYNNSRSNLRIGNSINQYNRGYKPTGYLPKGVKYSAFKFGAYIGYKGKQLYLGTYNTPEEAHQVYKEKAIELYGFYNSD